MKSLLDILIIRPNKWWDELPEPRRFLTFLPCAMLLCYFGPHYPILWAISIPIVAMRIVGFYLNNK